MGGELQILTDVDVNQLIVVKEEPKLTLWDKIIILIYAIL